MTGIKVALYLVGCVAAYAALSRLVYLAVMALPRWQP